MENGAGLRYRVQVAGDGTDAGLPRPHRQWNSDPADDELVLLAARRQKGNAVVSSQPRNAVVGCQVFGFPVGPGAVSHRLRPLGKKKPQRSSRTIRRKTAEWHFAVRARLRTPALRPRH